MKKIHFVIFLSKLRYNKIKRGNIMINSYYLLNMDVCGIKNIQKNVHLSFYKKTVDKEFDSEKYRVKAIYGENGAGKSALITAVKIFQNFILNNNYLNDSKTQIFLDEIVNKATQTFCFECEFLLSSNTVNRVHHYSVCIGKSENGMYEIQSESLKVKNGDYANSRYKMVFESRNGELTFLDCGDNEREWMEKKSMNLLSSHSFVGLYMKNFEVDNMDSVDLFINIIACMTFALVINVYIAEEDQHELYFLRKKLKGNVLDKQKMIDELFGYEDRVNTFFRVNESHVDKKYFEQYKERIGQLTQFIKIFKSDLVSIDIDAKENGEEYVCDLNLNYGDYVINKEFESTGIKKLIRLFDCFGSASTNGIVFIDEMDSNLNDVYLCKLIEYFMYYGKGQLCFTTHNLDPMTVLKENKNSIDFLSSDNHLVSWTSRGNASPDNCYKNGLIEDSPFNIDATDFVGIFGE